MVTGILLERREAIPKGVLTLQVNQQIEVNVTAEEAQRKVSRFVHLEISTQMHAEPPTLVVNDEVAWRVPVHLTFPSLGDVGCVGFFRVDPVTGDLKISPAVIQEIERNAEDLAIRFASPAAQPS